MRKTKKWVSLFLFFCTVARADVSKSRADVSYWRSRVTGCGYGCRSGRGYGAGAWIWCKILPEIAPARGGAWMFEWCSNFGRWRIWCRRFRPWWWWDERSSQDATAGGKTCRKVVHLTGAWRRVICFLTSIFLWKGERVPTIRTIGGILWTKASVNDNRGREIRLKEAIGYEGISGRVRKT